MKLTLITLLRGLSHGATPNRKLTREEFITLPAK